MKQTIFTLMTILITAGCFGQDRTYFTVVSNVTYAPFGLGVMRTVDEGTGWFANLKITDDVFLRNYSNETTGYKRNGFDADEVFLTAGVTKQITNAIDFYFGGGVMMGFPIYRASGQGEAVWAAAPAENFVAAPVLSWGVTLNAGKVLLLMGYDIAFVSADNYPVLLTDNNLVGRLTGITLGIGF